MRRFRLLPSAFRPASKLLDDHGNWIANKDVVDRSVGHQARREFNAFLAFLGVAESKGLRIPGDGVEFRKYIYAFEAGWGPDYVAEDWPYVNFIPALAVAQHYGIPTRLLDWSFNAKIAAYFAAKDASRLSSRSRLRHGHRLAVWATNGGDYESFESRFRYDPRRFGPRIFRVLAPNYGNDRLNAQEGLFTLYDPGSPAPFAPLDDRPLEGLRAETTIVPALTCVSLPAMEANRVLWALAKEGITAATAFPGFEGAAWHVSESEVWERT